MKQHVFVFFQMDPSTLKRYYAIYDQLLEAHNPKMYAQIKKLQIVNEMYLFPWFQVMAFENVFVLTRTVLGTSSSSLFFEAFVIIIIIIVVVVVVVVHLSSSPLYADAVREVSAPEHGVASVGVLLPGGHIVPVQDRTRAHRPVDTARAGQGFRGHHSDTDGVARAQGRVEPHQRWFVHATVRMAVNCRKSILCQTCPWLYC